MRHIAAILKLKPIMLSPGPALQIRSLTEELDNSMYGPLDLQMIAVSYKISVRNKYCATFKNRKECVSLQVQCNSSYFNRDSTSILLKITKKFLGSTHFFLQLILISIHLKRVIYITVSWLK